MLHFLIITGPKCPTLCKIEISLCSPGKVFVAFVRSLGKCSQQLKFIKMIYVTKMTIKQLLIVAQIYLFSEDTSPIKRN